MTNSYAEHCLRFPGASDTPTILVVPPLFDEANRMRRTLVQTMRALSAIGIACLLPDLPGQNDSLLQTEDATLMLWRAALADIAATEPGPVLIASWRGGALIDDAATAAIGWWRMAPVAGASIVKTMIRIRIAGEKESGRKMTADTLRGSADTCPVELGGNFLNAAMLSQLETAAPADVAPLRIVTLGSGKDTIPGSALWLRAEPGEDADMASAMAHDIGQWARLCAVR